MHAQICEYAFFFVSLSQIFECMRKIVLFCVFCAGVLMACSKQAKPVEVAPVPVSVLTVSTKADTTTRHYVGTVEADTKVDLSFPLGGTLTGLYVTNGQMVHKGDLIATIDDTRARSMHDAAEATLAQAEDAYERLRQVYEQGGISEVRWMQMKTDLSKARNSALSARKNMEDCSMVAPVDGIIDIQKVSVGSDIRPSGHFASVQNVDQMNVRYTIPEHEIDRIAIGDEVLVEVPARGDALLKARVVERSLIANPMGHTYTVCARLEDPNGVLPGMVAKVMMSKTGMVGVVIPAHCVVTVYDGQVVWLVRDSNVSRQHILCTDLVRNGILVTDGLEDGDIVVVEGYQKLYPGAKVTF